MVVPLQCHSTVTHHHPNWTGSFLWSDSRLSTHTILTTSVSLGAFPGHRDVTFSHRLCFLSLSVLNRPFDHLYFDPPVIPGPVHLSEHMKLKGITSRSSSVTYKPRKPSNRTGVVEDARHTSCLTVPGLVYTDWSILNYAVKSLLEPHPTPVCLYLYLTI